MVLALLTMLVAVVPSTSEFGPFLALGVAVMLLVSLTFVPAAVLLLGRAAFWPMKRVQRDPGEASFWGRVAALVIRRPGTVVVASVLLLGGLAVGVLGYAPNANLISDLRGDTDSLRGQQLLDESFPAGQLAPTIVLVEASEPAVAASTVAGAVRGVAGVSSVGPPVVADDGRTARLQVVYADDPYGTPALERTAQVRDVEEIATHGFTEGIRVALTRTGGVITSAGLILAGTFAALMTQPLNSLVQFGFAMAVGILLDTFLIRGVLVPGLFRLLGPRIWWPGRLSGSDPAGTRVSPRALERTG